MAAEEDKKFDAVLGGFLINDLRGRAGDFHCPESDTLAAYHERSLLPEEMNAWKEHIVGCARCQAILAELEATDSIPLQVLEKEELLTGAAATVDAASEPSLARKEAPLTPPAKSPVRPISRSVRWQWLVPAGAIAAGLLIWVAWHENRPQLTTPTETKTAKLEPPATPPSVTSDTRQATSADGLAGVSKDQSAIGGAVSGKTTQEAQSLKQFEKPVSRDRLTHSDLQANKQTGARTDMAIDSLSAANRGQSQPAQGGKAGVAGALSKTSEIQALTANTQPQNQQVQQTLQAQQNQLSDQRVSGPNPSRRAEKEKKSKSESPTLGYRSAAAAPSAPPAQSAPTAFNDSTALRMASAMSPYVISAPDGKTFWRAGHLGMVEFSRDGGASWSRQVSNVSADLTAGAAPSEEVCWIVGRVGTILLTTDAGLHWANIHSPLGEDLGGVRATDALHATIWNLANTKIFETPDGGLTWKPAQAQ